MFYIFDGDRFLPEPDLDAAKAAAEAAIDHARDQCDPEWPDWVEDIAIYEAEDGVLFPDEVGTLVAISRKIGARPPSEDEKHLNIDEWCDYTMDSPA